MTRLAGQLDGSAGAAGAAGTADAVGTVGRYPNSRSEMQALEGGRLAACRNSGAEYIPGPGAPGVGRGMLDVYPGVLQRSDEPRDKLGLKFRFMRVPASFILILTPT